jgi:hypothetical protein
MKSQSEATIQFSGYPLNVVEKKQKFQRTELIVIRSSVFNQTTISIQRNPLSNDPGNWDLDWFNGYE